MSKKEVKAGQVYELAKSGPIESQKEPNIWACRRVEDFPPGTIEKFKGAGFAICAGCHAPIVFNTARKVDAEKVCMQCVGITPDPYPEGES